MQDRPGDFSSVVASHWPKSVAYLQASKKPCIEIRDDEIAKIGGNRVLRPLEHGEFAKIRLDATWILGVILCPGDDVKDLIAWVKAAKVAPSRIWFFLHVSADMKILQAWEDAGHATNQVDIVDGWDDLHPIFGLMLSDQIYEEHGPKATPRDWVPGRKPKPKK